MSVRVTMVAGPLGPDQVEASLGPGARLVFEGIVRPTEGGQPIEALLYEAYRPMADRELEALGREILSRHGLSALRIEHSLGRVPAGAISMRLVVEATHRAEALTAAGEFLDRLKRDVPIWKATP
jgi:molybdopterin synthase catalytic subunit